MANLKQQSGTPELSCQRHHWPDWHIERLGLWWSTGLEGQSERPARGRGLAPVPRVRVNSGVEMGQER